MSRSASSLPSQFALPRLPRRLNRNISPLILDIRDYGSAFERDTAAEAALPPPPIEGTDPNSHNEGTDPKSRNEGTDPKSGSVPGSRTSKTGGLLVLLLFAALGALGTMVFLDAQRITLLERQVQLLSQQLDAE